jgi:hypothetical protein
MAERTFARGVIPNLISAEADIVGEFALTLSPSQYIYGTNNRLEIEADKDGLVPSSLRKIMENWPKGKPYPKLLYTVPVSSKRRLGPFLNITDVHSTAAIPLVRPLALNAD